MIQKNLFEVESTLFIKNIASTDNILIKTVAKLKTKFTY